MTWYVIKECLGNHKYRDIKTFEGDSKTIETEMAKAHRQSGERFIVQTTDAPKEEKKDIIRPAIAKRKR